MPISTAELMEFLVDLDEKTAVVFAKDMGWISSPDGTLIHMHHSGKWYRFWNEFVRIKAAYYGHYIGTMPLEDIEKTIALMGNP